MQFRALIWSSISSGLIFVLLCIVKSSVISYVIRSTRVQYFPCWSRYFPKISGDTTLDTIPYTEKNCCINMLLLVYPYAYHTYVQRLSVGYNGKEGVSCVSVEIWWKIWLLGIDAIVVIVFVCIAHIWHRPSSCLLKSIVQVQFSPSANTRRDFFLQEK